MQVGMTKDQGLYNKPLAAVYPGALAAGTLPQYDTIRPEKLRKTMEYVQGSLYSCLNSNQVRSVGAKPDV